MDEKKLIFVVEDNERFNNFISAALIKSGYRTMQAYNGRQAYDVFSHNLFDLVILDLNLGDVQGLSILKTIRMQDKLIPVMIISSISDDETKLEEFRIGCDDYLTKPFYISELLMRIRRMIERTSAVFRTAPVPIIGEISCGPFEINTAMLTVQKSGKHLDFTKKQFSIFLYLVENRGRIIPYRELYENVWEKIADDARIESNLYVHINSIRKQIEENPDKPVWIKSVRETGYLFAEE